MWVKHVNSIVIVPVLDGTPASVDPNTGTMFISAAWWNTATFEERLFVLFHECGHLENQSSSEMLADRYAFQKYAQEGHSPAASITGMRHWMPFKNDQQRQRLSALITLADQFNKSPKG